MFGSRFLDNGSSDSEKVCKFWKLIQGLHFPLRNQPINNFCSLTPKNGDSCGPTVVYALRRWLIAIFSLYFYALHKWLVSYCCCGQLAHASLCTVMYERFQKSDSKYYRRQSLWDEWRRVSHCPTNLWAFLLLYLIHATWKFSVWCLNNGFAQVSEWQLLLDDWGRFARPHKFVGFELFILLLFFRDILRILILQSGQMLNLGYLQLKMRELS